jgi:sulfur-oxidizing protein SoxY
MEMRGFFAPKAIVSFGFALGALATAFMTSPPARAAAGDDPAEREARWQDIAKSVFGDRKARDGAGVIELGTSLRAEDAALVPMTITLSGQEPIKGMYLIIDDNPSPVAAHFIFGPAADPREIKLRVRVNTYTNIHAIAETADGSLYQAVKFIKAAGGCSAPMGMTNEEAMKDIGDIRLRFPPDAAPEKPTHATLMVRHPNFNGMQLDQVTRNYTPARYIQSVGVTTGDQRVFDLETDISLASNPVISFGLIPQGEVKVAVTDSDKAHWEKSFPGPQLSN